jgi:peptide/nickel transport system permease protein
MLGLAMLILLFLGVVFIPIFSPFRYNDQNVFQWYAPAGTVTVDAGIAVKAGQVYWLGSDDYGRDVLTRLFFGGRITLSVAILATLLVLLIGSIIGGIAGYFGGIVDSAYMGITDLLLAFPLLPTFLLLTKIFPIGAEYSGWGGGFDDLYQTVEQAAKAAFGYALIFTILGWVPISRQVRAALLHLRTLEFIEAARALGASGWRITRKHLLPNALAPILLSGVLVLGDFIIYETILSYLGLGVGTPVPSWGNMIRDAQSQVWFITNTINPTEDIRGFLIFIPGMLILITVLSINFIAEGLRDTLSPH